MQKKVKLYIGAIALSSALFIGGMIGSTLIGNNHAPSSSAHTTTGNILMASTTTPTQTSRASSLTPTSPPARPTQSKPIATRPPVPTPKPKPTATPFPYHICTIASCPNPWGYHLQNGGGSPLVSSAPAGFCSWFLCANGFTSANGDIIACNDNAFDWTNSYYANRCENDQGIRGYLAP